MSIKFRIVALPLAAALAFSVQYADAYAQIGCDTIKECELKDYIYAANPPGIYDDKTNKTIPNYCAYLFIKSRYNNCIEARKTLHTSASCGPKGQNPGKCQPRANNRAILIKWRQCLRDREIQQSAFQSGLEDAQNALTVGPKKQRAKRKKYLDIIIQKIKAKQPGHQEQIDGVRASIRNCERFHPQ